MEHRHGAVRLLPPPRGRPAHRAGDRFPSSLGGKTALSSAAVVRAAGGSSAVDRGVRTKHYVMVIGLLTPVACVSRSEAPPPHVFAYPPPVRRCPPSPTCFFFPRRFTTEFNLS